MRVATYYNNKDVRLEERARPELNPGEILMKVEASGICGSDVLEWYRIHRAPLILGHEVSGTVVEVAPPLSAESDVAEGASGGGVTGGAGAASGMAEGAAAASHGYKVGDRIVAAHHVPCNTCYHCMNDHHTVCDTLRTTNFDPGGFVEYLRLPSINVDRGTFHLPDDMSFDQGTFVEPLACVLRGQRIAGVRAGQSVLVLGSGISGALHISLARAAGARRVFATDINDYRLNAAKGFGADVTLKADSDVPAGVAAANDGRLADVVIVCTGAPAAYSQALASVERGGTVLFFAPSHDDFVIPVPANRIFWRNEAKLVSSYAASPADHLTALELIRAGRVKVDDMITHRLPLADTVQGFKLVAEAGESLKVIVYPHQ